MQGCTIAVKVTGSDEVEPYIEREEGGRAIACIAPGRVSGAV
jgi:hypothetical protein